LYFVFAPPGKTPRAVRAPIPDPVCGGGSAADSKRINSEQFNQSKAKCGECFANDFLFAIYSLFHHSTFAIGKFGSLGKFVPLYF
jgi:hypothetical protein